MENNKTPKIRFKGFTDDWEQRELGEVANRYDNMRIPITASDRVAGNTPYYGANGIQDYVKGYTHKGEFVLVAEDGANDLKNYPVQYVNGEIWVNNHAHVLQGKAEKANNKYLKFAISQIDIEPFLVGGGRAKLNADIMMKMSLNMPLKLPEQTQIGTFFKTLDNLITCHQRKCDKLVNVKKSMLEKMFPKNGETIPEIRFKGFTDAWEQREAIEIFNTIADKGYPELPVLSATQEYGMVKRSTTGINIHHDKDNEVGYKRVQKGNFVMHLRSFQGGFAHSAVEGITSPAYTVLGFKEPTEHNDYFWKYILSSENFIKRLELITYGIRDGRSINFADFAEFMFYVPSCIEQKKIAEYFTNLDNLITHHQHELEKLKNIKKSLLEKMFV